MVMGSSGHCHEALGVFLAHLSNVFPSWTDYYCVIKKIKLGLLFFSEKSKEFHVISGIPILNSSLALSEVAGTHGYLLHRARASRRVTTPWSVWPLLPVPGGPLGQRWGPPSIPTLGRFGQSREGSAGVRGLAALSLLLIFLSVSRGGPGPSL